MRIRKLIAGRNTPELATIGPDGGLLATARKLRERKVGALPVVDAGGNMVGIISERDVVDGLARFEAAVFEKTVADVMTSPVITCTEEDSVERIYALMTERHIRHMPVVREGTLVGMLSMRDFEAVHKFLQAHSVTDDRTGLANERSFAGQLETEFNRFRRFQFPLSVIAVRIEGYNHFVARHGSPAGESILKGLGTALARETRSFDIVGHVCDDEFGVILPNTDPKSARRTCDRLADAARNFLSAEGVSAELATGIGLAFARDDTREAGSVLERARDLADDAMRRGGNHYAVEATVEHLSAAE